MSNICFFLYKLMCFQKFLQWALYSFIYLFIYLFIYSVYLGPYPWHMEVPRLGVQLELQLPAYATAQQFGIWAASVTYATGHGNTRSLAHWARPGIKPTTSWFLVSDSFPLRYDGNSKLYSLFKTNPFSHSLSSSHLCYWPWDAWLWFLLL